jgi:glycosyltransferase involved in cell wall biosynthesis
MKKPLTLSIIIPVYNEAHRLNACLDAIAAQTQMPDEVIVVDNNSSDQSTRIAQSYSFVKLLHENEQGLIPARNKGFNEAKSDILARIDADSIVSSDWVKIVKQSFSRSDIAGVTGPSYSLLLPRIRKPMTKMWSKLYFFWTLMFYRIPVLWGANMAIRRSMWLTIRDKVSFDSRTIHEDHDLSLLIQSEGKKIILNNKMLFTSYSQAYHYFPKLLHYTIMRHTTKTYHRNKGTFDTMVFDIPKAQSFIIYTIFWPIIFIFFLASFLAWPVDAAMKASGKLEDWLS